MMYPSAFGVCISPYDVSMCLWCLQVSMMYPCDYGVCRSPLCIQVPMVFAGLVSMYLWFLHFPIGCIHVPMVFAFAHDVSM